MVRLTLIDALPVDPTQDFGPPPAAVPQTDFYPVYRVDTIGFYGHDYVELRQPCDSYISANGTYSAATKRAHCPVGSNGEIRIHQNTVLYGSARTNGSFNTGSPWGGNGTADINAAIVAPNANVNIQGNFNFNGGIIAKSLTFTGSGGVHYDESLGGSTLTDATFKLRNELQYYQ